MKKILLIAFLIVWPVIAAFGLIKYYGGGDINQLLSQFTAASFRPYSGGLQGGATGALDKTTGTNDGDAAIVMLNDHATLGNMFLAYTLDDDGGGTEHFPDIIDSGDAGAEDWELLRLAGSGAYLFAATPFVSLYDINAAGLELADMYAGGVEANMTTTTEDGVVSDLILYTMVANVKTAGLTLDGSESKVVIATGWELKLNNAEVAESELEILDGATLSTTDLNIIDGISDSGSLTAAELMILDGVTATYTELNYLDIASLGTGAASKAVVLDGSGNYTFPAGAIDMGGVTTFEIWNSTSDMALAVAGQIGLQLTDDQLVFHGGAAGEIQGEAAMSLLDHIVLVFDPAWAYDQESTYRVMPVMYVGDDYPEGFTITEWRVTYVAGDPTTELDADLCFDTTPDYNPAAGMTVMDVIDTTAGASTADTGFDSATASNGSQMYIRFGADPTDANVLIKVDIWGYGEED